MKTIKLKAIRNVNIRKDAPKAMDNNLKGVIYKGQEFELNVEEIEDDTCDSISGNRKWYKDANGDYLWSGGFEVINSNINLNNIESVGWHIKKFNIEKIWSITKGKGVTVAVLDSGIMMSHPDIEQGNIIGTKNFLYEGDDEELIKDVSDHTGHGTHCAGIIASQGNKIKGIAPNVSLLIGKITDTKLGVDQDKLFSGIKWAYENNADVISVSAILENFKSEYITEITKLNNKHPGILISCLSNDGDLDFDIDYYPSLLKECIAVGSINEKMQIDDLTSRAKKLDILAPGRDILSTWNNGAYKSESGCSMATPFVAATIALMISYYKNESKAINKQEIINKIISQVSHFAQYKTRPGKNIPIIDPYKLFNL